MKRSLAVSGIILIFVAIVVIVVVGSLYSFRNPSSSQITSFEECAKAGYPVLQSYPRQCKTSDGRTFVERIAPIISILSPPSGPTATGVVITGSGFTPTNNKVYFGPKKGLKGVITNLFSDDGSTLTFEVPDGLNIECNPGEPCIGMHPQVLTGEYEVSVSNANGISNILIFTVTGE